jgi:ammonia channel protein AmtB
LRSWLLPLAVPSSPAAVNAVAGLILVTPAADMRDFLLALVVLANLGAVGVFFMAGHGVVTADQ